MAEKHICPGFKAAGIFSGIKKNGDKDLGLIVSDEPASVAGVFTRNVVKAAPVVLCRKRAAGGSCRAVVVNSGNANCCTGEQGMRDALAMTALVSDGIGVPEDQVLVSSTGVIGAPLPMDKVRDAIPTLVESLSPEGMMDCATAIMTTDTIPKMVSRQGTLDGKPFTVTGMIKGAGMIRPDMATMLCFIMTDADAEPGFLQQSLANSADRSFNRATIDGDTSTNDTVLVMANGVSGAVVKGAENEKIFQALLDEVCRSLTRAMVRDGEGVNTLVELRVVGAASDADALRIADTVAHSPLVKTAIFGRDANWGRIMGAAGRAGVDFDPGRIAILFDDVRVVDSGMGCGTDAEARAARVMQQPEITLTIDLNAGDGSAAMLTCDFSVDYVKINADYRS
jgi:glutamate N-acetyltransferase/amino-acid N-acetyltransferase